MAHVITQPHKIDWVSYVVGLYNLATYRYRTTQFNEVTPTLIHTLEFAQITQLFLKISLCYIPFIYSSCVYAVCTRPPTLSNRETPRVGFLTSFHIINYV